jgi:D-alanine transaminase
MPDIGFVNGRFTSLADAVVSVEDRGFQFGDGVYEVIRTYGGRPFQLEAHLARLERSAAALRLPVPHPRHRWTAWVMEGLARASYPESKIYIQITRGPAPRDHTYPPAGTPTVVMTIRALPPFPDDLRSQGVSAITVEDIRWGRCDIKSVNLLANVLARQQAKEAGVFEAICIKDGMVTEGAVSNVMVVHHGTLLTAPEGERILSGVTRTIVLDLARREGLAVHERFVPRADLDSADEVLLTGTTVEVLSVVRLDGKPIGSGRPGPVGERLARQFSLLTR